MIKLIFTWICYVLWISTASASPWSVDETPVKEQDIKTCDSFESFQGSVQFLSKDKDLSLSDTQVVQIALQISKNCTGAAKRFETAYSMMKSSGVDLKKAIKIGVEFSAVSDAQVQNFVDVFKGVYLENYFNFDFPLAYNVANELSKKAKEGSVEVIRKDFVSMLKFCMEKQNLNLPLNFCSTMALKLCDDSYLFPKTGAFPDFVTFFNFTRNEPSFGLSIKDALTLALEVLAYGPKSIPNFTKTFQYSTDKKGLNLNAKASLKLSLEIAKQSLTMDANASKRAQE